MFYYSTDKFALTGFCLFPQVLNLISQETENIKDGHIQSQICNSPAHLVLQRYHHNIKW